MNDISRPVITYNGRGFITFFFIKKQRKPLFPTFNQEDHSVSLIQYNIHNLNLVLEKVVAKSMIL